MDPFECTESIQTELVQQAHHYILIASTLVCRRVYEERERSSTEAEAVAGEVGSSDDDAQMTVAQTEEH